MKRTTDLAKLLLAFAFTVITAWLGAFGNISGAIENFKGLFYIMAGVGAFIILSKFGVRSKGGIKLRYDNYIDTEELDSMHKNIGKENAELARKNAMLHNNRIFAVKGLAIRVSELRSYFNDAPGFQEGAFAVEEEIENVAIRLWKDGIVCIAGDYFIGSRRSAIARMLYDNYIAGVDNCCVSQRPEDFLRMLNGYFNAKEGSNTRKNLVADRSAREFWPRIEFANKFYRSKIVSSLLSFEEKGVFALFMLLTGYIKVIDGEQAKRSDATLNYV
ncbi:MAG: hypothetical protein ACP5SJ_00625 [Candidatus Micrarchaeia archaeon]